MNLSAVIVTYNSADVLEVCWRSLRAMIPEAEIIVVDNASTDGTRRLCQRLDGVILIANNVNSGFGRACNQGVRSANGARVMILNPDVQLTAFAPRALETPTPEQRFGLVAPALEAGPRGGSTAQPWVLGLVAHVVSPLRPRELPRLPTVRTRPGRWWPPGALLLVDREEFVGLGGFDERFFLYYEDRDLARRYRAADLPVRGTEFARAAHLHGKSSTGEGSGLVLRNGWSYLSWLEYLCSWDGRDTAARAARSACVLTARIDRTLAALERLGPTAVRARRKRNEFAELAKWVRWQSSFAEGTAPPDFCPRARAIVAAL